MAGRCSTSLEGRVVDSFFVRILPTHPERLSEGARAVNGFDADRWRRRSIPSSRLELACAGAMLNVRIYQALRARGMQPTPRE